MEMSELIERFFTVALFAAHAAVAGSIVIYVYLCSAGSCIVTARRAITNQTDPLKQRQETSVIRVTCIWRRALQHSFLRLYKPEVYRVIYSRGCGLTSISD
jgi:hypothetical protein